MYAVGLGSSGNGDPDVSFKGTALRNCCICSGRPPNSAQSRMGRSTGELKMQVSNTVLVIYCIMSGCAFTTVSRELKTQVSTLQYW